MVVKKDLQLIVCPCVFEPWALLLLWVSTKSSSTVSSQSTKNPFFHHAVRRRPFLCFSQSLPFFLCVLKFFLLVSFPIICSLALPRSLTFSPPSLRLPLHLLQLNSCWVQSRSKNIVICFTCARDKLFSSKTAPAVCLRSFVLLKEWLDIFGKHEYKFFFPETLMRD